MSSSARRIYATNARQGLNGSSHSSESENKNEESRNEESESEEELTEFDPNLSQDDIESRARLAITGRVSRTESGNAYSW